MNRTNRFCVRCHRPYNASPLSSETHYICPVCDQRNMRAKYGKQASIYPQGVTVKLLEEEHDGIKKINQGFGRVCALAIGDDGAAVGADVMVEKCNI